MKYCSNCENKLIEGLKYCFKCGADVETNMSNDNVNHDNNVNVNSNVNDDVNEKAKSNSRLSAGVFDIFMS